MVRVARILVAFVAASVWATFPAPPAHAVPPAIALSPNAGPPTAAVTVTGRGFGPSEVVDVAFDASPVGTTNTNPGGKFSTTVAVPAEAMPGGHDVTATGESSGLTATASFIVRTDWPRFHFDPANTGFNPYEKVLNASNVSTLVQKWSAPTSSGVSPNPVVAGGILFVPSADGVVHALDAVTGDPIWSADIAGAATGAAVDVSGGNVYVSQDSGLLFALSAQTGEVVWSDDLGGYPVGSPTAAGGRVYGSVDTFRLAFAYAVDASTGALVWKHQSAGDARYPAVAEGRMYTAGPSSPAVGALDSSTGSPIWWIHLCGNEICEHGSVAAADGMVFIDYWSGVYALDAATGSLGWAAPQYVLSDAVPAVANGGVYEGTSRGQLFAWSERTGALLWKVPFPGGSAASSPAVANGVLYIGSNDGSLYAFDAVTGGQLWKSPTTDSPFEGAPAVVNGMLYDATDDGTVYAFGLP